MNNGFNQNGQFDGWASSPYGNGAGMYNEQYLRYLRKKQETKEVRKIGVWCGLAVIGLIAYNLLPKKPEMNIDKSRIIA